MLSLLSSFQSSISSEDSYFSLGRPGHQNLIFVGHIASAAWRQRDWTSLLHNLQSLWLITTEFLYVSALRAAICLFLVYLTTLTEAQII
jgi:hypothetical protein